jgi:hypothetical protein
MRDYVRNDFIMFNQERPKRNDKLASDERSYGDVVALVRRLGDEAVSEFLDGLSPHLLAVQSRERGAAKGLSYYLHQCAVSAVVIDQAGGSEAMRQKVFVAEQQEPPKSQDQVLAELRTLSS